MRIKLVGVTFLLLLNFFACAQQIALCSWNLKDFGKSKTDETLNFIVKTLQTFDVVAIQEVVAGKGGMEAVVKLTAQLNSTGNQWCYEVSKSTSGKNTNERYAVIWKMNKVEKVGLSWLDNSYQHLIEREPYLSKFKVGNKVFTLVSFHALPKAKHPETEIKYLRFYPALYPKDQLIFCGDFNLPQSHSVFNPLRNLGYIAALVKQKTSLRQACIDDDCLASEYDNLYFNPHAINVKQSGVVHFYRFFETLKQARKVSDHLPVYISFAIN
jgi:deoxyribonuclease-1-like protein